MKPVVHAMAGAIAMLAILSFWTSTVTAELFLSDEAVVAVKRAILYGLLVLIPVLAAAGGSGFALAGARTDHLVEDKKRRMRIIAANGILILAPAAFILHGKASAGEFDAVFHGVQAVELLAGLVQILLMGLSIRDGRKLAGHSRPAPGVRSEPR